MWMLFLSLCEDPPYYALMPESTPVVPMGTPWVWAPHFLTCTVGQLAGMVLLVSGREEALPGLCSLKWWWGHFWQHQDLTTAGATARSLSTAEKVPDFLFSSFSIWLFNFQSLLVVPWLLLILFCGHLALQCNLFRTNAPSDSLYISFTHTDIPLLTLISPMQHNFSKHRLHKDPPSTAQENILGQFKHLNMSS